MKRADRTALRRARKIRNLPLDQVVKEAEALRRAYRLVTAGEPWHYIQVPKNWIETTRVNAVLRRLGAPTMAHYPIGEFYRKQCHAAIRALDVGIERYYEQKEAQE